MSTSLNIRVSHNLSTPVKTQWATSTRTQTTSQYICKPYCTHIHVHTWSNAQMHNHTLWAKKKIFFSQKNVQNLWANLEFLFIRLKWSINESLWRMSVYFMSMKWYCRIRQCALYISSVSNLIEAGVSQGTEAAYRFNWLTKQA